MKITFDEETSNQYIVFLNGQLIRCALAADDKEGWVEILDISSMAPLDFNKSDEIVNEDLPEPFQELKTIKKYGQIEIKNILTKQ